MSASELWACYHLLTEEYLRVLDHRIHTMTQCCLCQINVLCFLPSPKPTASLHAGTYSKLSEGGSTQEAFQEDLGPRRGRFREE